MCVYILIRIAEAKSDIVLLHERLMYRIYTRGIQPCSMKIYEVNIYINTSCFFNQFSPLASAISFLTILHKFLTTSTKN